MKTGGRAHLSQRVRSPVVFHSLLSGCLTRRRRERSGVIMERLISWRSDLLAAYAASSPLITSTFRYTDLSRRHFAGIYNPENPALIISLGLELIA